MKHTLKATLIVDHKPGCDALPVSVAFSTMEIIAGQLPPQKVIEAICLGCGPVNVVAITTDYTTARVSHE